MFEVGLLKISFGTDFKERRIGVIHTAVETMGVLVTRQQILFDAFGAGGSLTEFAERLLSKNRCKVLAADHARFRLNDFIGKLLRRFSSHGVDYFNGKKRINFLKNEIALKLHSNQWGLPFSLQWAWFSYRHLYNSRGAFWGKCNAERRLGRR